MSDKEKHGSDNLIMKVQRIRNIKPEFFLHEGLYDAEEKSGLPIRLALTGLWTCCDKNGRFEWKPRQLKAKIFPYDQLDFAKVLDALAEGDFIRPYEAGGQRYGYIPTWRKHQAISMSEAKTKFHYPAPNGFVDQQYENVPVSESVMESENESVSKSVMSMEAAKLPTGTGIGASNSFSLEQGNSKALVNPNTDIRTLAVRAEEANRGSRMFGKHDPDLDMALPEATALAKLLYNALPPDKQTEAPEGWEFMWAKDIQEGLLEDEAYETVAHVISVLPRLKLMMYVYRGDSFVKMWPKLKAAVKKAEKSSAPRSRRPDEAEEDIVVQDINVEEL